MKPYEKAGRLFIFLGWLSLIMGAAAVLGPIILGGFSIADPVSLVPLISLSIILVGLSIFQLKVGAAIKAHKDWGRVAGIVLGIIQLIGFPIGTILGIYILWCLLKGWDK